MTVIDLWPGAQVNKLVYLRAFCFPFRLRVTMGEETDGGGSGSGGGGWWRGGILFECIVSSCRSQLNALAKVWEH